MPYPAAPRRPQAKSRVKPPAESFLFKTLLVVSALVLGALVVATEEFYFSTPSLSLSETEASLLLAKLAPASVPPRPTPLSN